MRISQAVFILFVCVILSCKKDSSQNNLPDVTKLDYGSSVFYVKEASYTISPLKAKTGTYSAFPNTLKIDKTTGVVTVSLKGTDGENQAGLRYKITYKSNSSGEVDSAFINLSGITYVDRFYNLAQNDSIIYPIYNCDPSRTLPPGNYDLSGDNKFAINPNNGQIDIKACIRRGFFDNQLNASWKEQKIKYRINDGSNNVINSIDVIIYYYNTMNDVPKNVSALMQAHQTLSVGVNKAAIPSTPGTIDNNLSSDLSLSKPRPPCIIIVGH